MTDLLLTPEERLPFSRTSLVDYGDVTVGEEIWDIDGLLKAQLAKCKKEEYEFLDKIAKCLYEQDYSKGYWDNRMSRGDKAKWLEKARQIAAEVFSEGYNMGARDADADNVQFKGGE